jgi:hypothetical protein
MNINSKEHYDLITAFEKEPYFRGCRRDKEGKEFWKIGQIYQSGEVNEKFVIYRMGYAYGLYVGRNESNAHAEMYHDLHEAVVEMCEHCDNCVADKCKKEDGKCFVQRWIKTLKKARGE